MDTFYFINREYNKSSNYNNRSSGSSHFHMFVNGMTFPVILISFPVTLVAIYALYSLIRKDHVAPVYVINLLISDIIQLCFMCAEAIQQQDSTMNIKSFFYIYYFGLMASVGFMVCVALERYLAIAYPLWYHFRRTIKTTVVTCAIVWALPILCLLPVYFVNQVNFSQTVFSIFFLLPFPLLIFFLVGTIKSLSKTSSVPPDEKCQIVAILLLVLLIYMLLFMPTIIWSLVQKARVNSVFTKLSFTFMQFSPLADCFLYVFLKKGAVGRSLVNLCCCKMKNKNISASPV